MKNINNVFNVYIPIPLLQNNCYLQVKVYKKFDKLNKELLKSYNTNYLSFEDKYQLLLFNSDDDCWQKFCDDVDFKKFDLIAVNFPFNVTDTYLIQYSFFDLQNDLLVYSDITKDIFFGQPKDNVQVFQKINIPQLIYKTDNIIALTWQHSYDFDAHELTYQLQLYEGNELTLKISDIPKSAEQQQTCQLILNDWENVTCDNGVIEYCSFKNVFIHKQQKEVNICTLFNQTIYNYRVRAKDSFGEYSQWSEKYYFKKINYLLQKVIVKKYCLFDLFQSIFVKHWLDDLFFQLTVVNWVYNNLFQIVHVTKNNYFDLNFGINIIELPILYDNLFQAINVKQRYQNLYMNLIISKTCYNNIFSSINVYSRNKLKFKLYIPILIRQKIDVLGRYQSDRLQFKIQIMHLSPKLLQTINVGHFFIQDLFFNCFVKFRDYSPLQIKVYDYRNNLMKLDNRLQLYNQKGEKIFAFDLQKKNINVYPYIPQKHNNKIQIYTEQGEIIQQAYDINGNLISQFYDYNNKVKNWLPIGTYYVEYTAYSQDISYLYCYGYGQDDVSFNKYTTLNKVLLNFNEQNDWFFAIKAIDKIGNAIHQHYTKQHIYINDPIKAIQPPFYLMGNIMDNNNVLYASNPYFSFNNNNLYSDQLIEYQLQISSDVYFNNIIQNKTISNQIESAVINVNFQPCNYYQDNTVYYFRIVSRDLDLNRQIKSQAFSNVRIFFFSHIYLTPLEQNIALTTQYWYLLAANANIRGFGCLKQNMIVFKQIIREKYDLKQTISWVYLKNVIKDIEQQLMVRAGLVLQQRLMVLKNYKDLFCTQLVYFDYSHFPITQTYIDENGQEQIKVIRQIPKEHFLHFSVMVYKYDAAKHDDEMYFVNFKLANILKRYESQDVLLSSILVSRRFDSEIKQNTIVWNWFNLPYSQKTPIHVLLVSNFVINWRPLAQELVVYYPPPPNVIVTSNIEEGVWQTNYKAIFNFELNGEANPPLNNYIYIIDRKSDTIPTLNNSSFATKQVRCDLRSIDDKLTGIYYIHVRAVNVKNILSQETTHYCVCYNNRIATPTAISINGLIVAGYNVPVLQHKQDLVLYWTKITDPIDVLDIITYDIQISSDVKFSDIVYSKYKIYGNTFTIPAKTLSANRYYWRVRAYDQNEYSDWSVIVSFYINKAPEAPTRLAVIHKTI